MSRDLKTHSGKLDWNIFKTCYGKVNALCPLSVTAIYERYYNVSKEFI